MERGYRSGWLFYKCRDAGLLDAYEELKAAGLIGDMPPAAPPPVPRLTIELVPQTCWFSNVRSHVSADDWDRLKELTFGPANFRCEICGGQGRRWPVECHELWHYDDAVHTQTLTGLIALCPACHEVKHMGLANVRGRGDVAARHLARINGWSGPETEQYIAAQFALWQRRSQFKWRLDIRWLEQFGISVEADHERDTDPPGNRADRRSGEPGGDRPAPPGLH